MPRRGLTIYSKALTDRRGEGTAFAPGDALSPHMADEDPVTRSCEAFLATVRSTVESLSRGREAVTVVAARLGHRDTSTTLKVYSHLMPGADGRAASVIGSAFSRPRQEDS